MNDDIRLDDLRKTPLYDWNRKHRAKMAPFAGYAMPLSYGGEIREYSAVRKNAGLFDISHMGVIDIYGADAKTFLQRLTTNDIDKLRNGDAQYSLICNDSGHILDDVLVYRASETHFFLVVNAGNVAKIEKWLSSQECPRLEISKKECAILALQGPRAEEVLFRSAPHIHLPEERYTFTTTTALWYGMSVVISRTGYTGEDGFEIICPASAAVELWEEFLDAGKPFDILPCGLVARDILRLEAGNLLYGNDIDETTNPVKAGLKKIIAFSKKDFIGKYAIREALAQEEHGEKHLRGFIVDTGILPKHGDKIFPSEEIHGSDEIGTVTSATFSPHLKKRVFLGYVDEKKHIGDTILVKTGEDRFSRATIAALPFYSRKK